MYVYRIIGLWMWKSIPKQSSYIWYKWSWKVQSLWTWMWEFGFLFSFTDLAEMFKVKWCIVLILLCGWFSPNMYKSISLHNGHLVHVSVIYPTLRSFLCFGKHLKPFCSQYWRDYCKPLALDQYFLHYPTWVFDWYSWWNGVLGWKKVKRPCCIILTLFLSWYFCNWHNGLQSKKPKIKALIYWLSWDISQITTDHL